MTDTNHQEPDGAPAACTLPLADQPVRLAEFDALFRTAVDCERLDVRHLRLALRGETALEATVRDLAGRESECCSFFTFTIDAPQPGRVHLDIEVPAGHVEVLDALAERAARRSAEGAAGRGRDR